MQRVGKMTLNRNPDNFFAETEQVAFNTTNIVPGIDFSDDPLLQGRNFSYLDTQLSRLGSPNFTELPINRPLCPSTTTSATRTCATRSTRAASRTRPRRSTAIRPTKSTNPRGFVSYPEQVSGPKVRERSESFDDHYGQARLFWNSMTPPEKEHIVKALQFELSKVETREVRVRMLGHLSRSTRCWARRSASRSAKRPERRASRAAPRIPSQETRLLADATSPTTASGGVQSSDALSMAVSRAAAKGRKVAILAEDGMDAGQVVAMQAALKAEGCGRRSRRALLGDAERRNGGEAGQDVRQHASVLFDAIFVPGGAGSVARCGERRRELFVARPTSTARRSAPRAKAWAWPKAPRWAACSPPTCSTPAAELAFSCSASDRAGLLKDFVAALAHHRFFNRRQAAQIAA